MIKTKISNDIVSTHRFRNIVRKKLEKSILFNECCIFMVRQWKEVVEK